MGCGCHHAVIRFLESRYGFRGVDLLFRNLVESFHQIPSCASFGVSCAGHFSEKSDTDESRPDSFYPEPWGHLDIAIIPSEVHIRELLELLQTTIGSHADASFKKIDHVFGPPKASKVEIWEIRIGDNGAFKSLKEKYHGGYLNKNECKEAYLESKQRYAEITVFWASLERVVADFCAAHEFTDRDIDKRAEEIFGKWAAVKHEDQNPEEMIQSITDKEGGRGIRILG